MGNLFNGVFLMVVGMGTVYLFLTLLMLLTEAIRRVWGDKPEPPAPAAGPRSPAEDETLRAAVVTAALLHHRRPRP